MTRQARGYLMLMFFCSTVAAQFYSLYYHNKGETDGKTKLIYLESIEHSGQLTVKD